MKPNLFTSLSIVALLLLSACSNEELLSETSNQYNVDFGDTKVTESTLSVTQALNNMNFVYRNFDKEQQKERRIKRVDLIKSSNLRSATRSGNTEDLPLAYIVNFDNEAGYAILGADDRMPPIIMLGDEGNFSTENYLEFLQKSETRSGNNEVDVTNPHELQYAMVTNAVTPGVNLNSLVPISPILSPAHDTTMVFKCWPILKTKWGQRAPYNNFVPYDPIYSSLRSAAGCVPIATSQLLSAVAYHHNHIFRTSISENFDVDWVEIINTIQNTPSFHSTDTSDGAVAVGNLVAAVGEFLETDYSYSGSTASTSDVPSLLLHLGFDHASYGAFSKDDAYEMIVNKMYPYQTRATGVDGSGKALYHSFVLDGWLRLEYSKNTFYVEDSTAINPSLGEILSQQRRFDLIHVNFGWNGSCDGYYTPGAFDLYASEFWEYNEAWDIYNPSNAVYDINVHSIVFEL